MVTKQLREWTAPDEKDVVYRYNPDTHEIEHKSAKATMEWVEFSATDYMDAPAWLQDELKKLIADPYVPEPKGLREQIADALSNAYEAGRYGLGAPGWSGVSTIAGAVMDVIDRERPALGAISDADLIAEVVRRNGSASVMPALGEVDAEVLVGELVRRGWKERPSPPFGHIYVVHGRVLIAPERAG